MRAPAATCSGVWTNKFNALCYLKHHCLFLAPYQCCLHILRSKRESDAKTAARFTIFFRIFLV